MSQTENLLNENKIFGMIGDQPSYVNLILPLLEVRKKVALKMINLGSSKATYIAYYNLIEYINSSIKNILNLE